MISKVAVLSFVLLAPSAVASAEVVGTTILGGKRVELLNDNTWRFSDSTATGKCVPINEVINFCGSILDWKPSPTTGSDFTRLFRHDARHYAGIIYEDVGAADGMDLEFMRNIAIQAAADASGVAGAQIPIYGVEDAVVDGMPAETISYGAKVENIDFTYQNTIVSTDHHTIQFVFWHLGAELTEKAIELNNGFLEAFELHLPEVNQ